MAGDSVTSEMSALLLVRAQPGYTLADVTDRMRDAASVLAQDPAVTRLVVSIPDVDPGDAVWFRPGEESAAEPTYQTVVELSARQEAFDGALAAAAAALAPVTEAVHAYRVSRLPARLDHRQAPTGARTPGIRYLVLCRFHPDLPDSAARRSWDHHVPLALRVHQGAARYVRTWIDAALTPGAPPFQGMTELYFPTREDMRERWFGSDDQRREIIQDIGHFLHSGVRLYTSEYVIKDERPDAR